MQTQCHTWTGFRNPDGYGMLKVDGRARLAPRVAWLIHYGRWPEPQALHRCDGGMFGCVRVDHLFEGSQRENVDDMMLKGRASPLFLRGLSPLNFRRRLSNS